MAGADYFVVYDDVFNDSVAHRFAWFTQARDEMPALELVKGGVRERERLETRVATREVKGVWRDGLGDSMAVVSHRKDLKIEGAPFGAGVSGPGWRDLVFRDPAGVRYSGGGISFEGKAGLVREAADGEWQASVFESGTLTRGDVTLAAEGISVSAAGSKAGPIQGRIASAAGGRLRIDAPSGLTLYLNGAPVPSRALSVPRGAHVWELTAGPPHPPAPRINRTENSAGSALIHFAPSAGAASYRIEMSTDGGSTWTPAGMAARSPFRLTGLTDGRKVHARITAQNDAHASLPGPEYPVYPTSRPPGPPDGLRLVPGMDRVDASWGEVLGASGYVLYRRPAGSGNWSAIYRGLERSFTDRLAG